MIDHKFQIHTDRLVIKIINEDDVDSVFETINNENTAKIVSFLEWPMTKAQAQKWCNLSLAGIKNQTDFLFIAQNETSNIGCAGVHVQKDNMTAEIGYWISEHSQGKGYATEIAKSIINFALKDLSIEKLFATADKENIGSFRVLEKTGFRLAGNTNVTLPNGSKRKSRLYELNNES